MSKEYHMFKSCFYPWERSDIAFDSILALSLTCPKDDVYLAKYIKTKGSIELLFTDTEHHIVASLKDSLLPGINSYQLTGVNGELVGVVSLIDTPLYETYIEDENSDPDGRLRISPVCFANIDVDIAPSTININGINTPLNAQEIILDDSLGATLVNNTLTIKPVIDIDTIRNNENDISYVTSIGTRVVHADDDGNLYVEYHVYLPSVITVESVVNAKENFNSIVTLLVNSEPVQCYSNTQLTLYSPAPPTEENKDIYPFTSCFELDKESNVYSFNLNDVESNIAEKFELPSDADWDKLRLDYDK